MSKRAVRKTTTIEDWEKSLAVRSAKRMYVSAVANLGWQLAIAVLVPVMIGSWLDDRYNTSPSYTLAALILSTASAVVIISRTIKQVNKSQGGLKSRKKHA